VNIFSSENHVGLICFLWVVHFLRCLDAFSRLYLSAVDFAMTERVNVIESSLHIILCNPYLTKEREMPVTLSRTSPWSWLPVLAADEVINQLDVQVSSH